MKTEPRVMNKLTTVHTSYRIDFTFENNITLINGDSGEGKSAVYSFIEELATEDKRIRCFDYKNINENYRSAIRNSKGKLFVIDNADILLTDRLRQFIAFDDNNQYLLIGRNPTGLLLLTDNIFNLVSSTENGITTFTIVNAFR